MARTVMVDLPRTPVIYAGDYKKYNELILKDTALTTTGDSSWTSPSSGINYPATTGGEAQLLGLLQTALDPYILNASKYNGMLKYKTFTIPITGWVANTGDYVQKYFITDADIDANSFVDAFISDIDKIDVASDAEMSPTMIEASGGVWVYAKTVPTATIPIRYRIT